MNGEVISLRFHGDALAKRSLPVYELATALIAVQRIVHKAALFNEGKLGKGVHLPTDKRETLALQIARHDKGSDLWGLSPYLTDPAIGPILQGLIIAGLAGLTAYAGKKVLPKKRPPKNHTFVVNIFPEVKMLVDRVGNIGGVEKIEVVGHSDLIGQTVLLDGNTRDYVRSLEYQLIPGRKMTISGVITQLLPQSFRLDIKVAPKRYVQVKLDPELFEKVKLHARGSLLEFLVSRGELLGDLGLPWDQVEVTEVGRDLHTWLDDGRCYSELLWGAQLLYNLMLAQKKQNLEERVSEFGALLKEWSTQIESRQSHLKAWNRVAFWGRLRRVNPRLPHGVWRFSEAWITRVLDGNKSDIASDLRVQELIRNRERELKGPRARLFSQAHLDLWRGAASPEPLNFRWWVTRRMVNDIVTGLKRRNAS